MKSAKLTVLASLLVAAGSTAAQAAPITADGPAAMALARGVGSHSPLLSTAEKKAVVSFFAGNADTAYPKKISVTADKIVCRISHVDITSRSCDLTFGHIKHTVAGRQANEIFATQVLAGVPSDGAAGAMLESLARLNCTLDPAEIREKAGVGARCSFEAGEQEATSSFPVVTRSPRN